ncbi:MAG: hypothetical protein R8G66_30080 [Cytophagales bacterium]|nr:hypothetical protein [Cytophagales bacterium]
MSTEQNKGEGCIIWGAFILFFGFGVFLILWNARRVVVEKDRLQLAEELAVKIRSDVYNPELEGELVVLAGPISTDYVFNDPQYGMEFNGINYIRNVAVFSEVEEEYYFVPTYQHKKSNFEEDSYIPEAYASASYKLKADSGIYIGMYKIDTALLTSEDLYEDPIPVESYLNLEVGKSRFYKVDVNVITDSKDFNNPQLEDLEVEFRGLASGVNVTVLGMQKDSAIVKPDWRIPYGAVRGYRDAAAITKDLNQGEWGLDLNFKVFGVMALFIGTLAFRFIIRKSLYKLTNQNLLALRGHIFLTSVALCTFVYWVLSGLGAIVFGQAFVAGLIALGKATLLAVPFIFLVRKKIPGFLFKQIIAEEAN